MTVKTGGIHVTQGVSVFTGGMKVTGGLTINEGLHILGSGLEVASTGVQVDALHRSMIVSTQNRKYEGIVLKRCTSV